MNSKATKQLELETFGLSDAETHDIEDKDALNILSSHFISTSLRENIYLFLSSPESSIPVLLFEYEIYILLRVTLLNIMSNNIRREFGHLCIFYSVLDICFHL
jgi:hypothetical protein